MLEARDERVGLVEHALHLLGHGGGHIADGRDAVVRCCGRHSLMLFSLVQYPLFCSGLWLGTKLVLVFGYGFVNVNKVGFYIFGYFLEYRFCMAQALTLILLVLTHN